MTERFRNDPIPIDDVPQLTDDAFVPVDPRYLRASLAGTGVTAAIVLGIGLFAASQSDATGVAAATTGGVLFLVALSAVLRILEVRRLAYQLREHDISKRSGVITHRVESLPFARVQHVRVNRGAIERALGLATLQISSAGPNIVIPGLTDAEASRIKLLVTERAGMEPDTDDQASSPPAAPAPTPLGSTMPPSSAMTAPAAPSPPAAPPAPPNSPVPPTAPPAAPSTGTPSSPPATPPTAPQPPPPAPPNSPVPPTAPPAPTAPPTAPPSSPG